MLSREDINRFLDGIEFHGFRVSSSISSLSAKDFEDFKSYKDDINKCIKSSCLKVHPDKGGNVEAFLTMREIHEKLLKEMDTETEKRWLECLVSGRQEARRVAADKIGSAVLGRVIRCRHERDLRRAETTSRNVQSLVNLLTQDSTLELDLCDTLATNRDTSIAVLMAMGLLLTKLNHHFTGNLRSQPLFSVIDENVDFSTLRSLYLQFETQLLRTQTERQVALMRLRSFQPQPTSLVSRNYANGPPIEDQLQALLDAAAQATSWCQLIATDSAVLHGRDVAGELEGTVALVQEAAAQAAKALPRRELDEAAARQAEAWEARLALEAFVDGAQAGAGGPLRAQMDARLRARDETRAAWRRAAQVLLEAVGGPAGAKELRKRAERLSLSAVDAARRDHGAAAAAGMVAEKAVAAGLESLETWGSSARCNAAKHAEGLAEAARAAATSLHAFSLCIQRGGGGSNGGAEGACCSGGGIGGLAKLEAAVRGWQAWRGSLAASLERAAGDALRRAATAVAVAAERGAAELAEAVAQVRDAEEALKAEEAEPDRAALSQLESLRRRVGNAEDALAEAEAEAGRVDRRRQRGELEGAAAAAAGAEAALGVRRARAQLQRVEKDVQVCWERVFELAVQGFPELPAKAADVMRLNLVGPKACRLLAPLRRFQQYGSVERISGRGQSRHDVYRAELGGQQVVLKQFELGGVLGGQSLRVLERELEQLARMQHPCVLAADLFFVEGRHCADGGSPNYCAWVQFPLYDMDMEAWLMSEEARKDAATGAGAGGLLAR